MEHNERKAEIQEWLNRDFEAWVRTYSPRVVEGAAVLLTLNSEAPEKLWSLSDEFVHDFYLAKDGSEISMSTVDILAGVDHDTEDDVVLVSDKSWAENDDDFLQVKIEVVMTCLSCLGKHDKCPTCGYTGEWTFLAAKWQDFISGRFIG